MKVMTAAVVVGASVLLTAAVSSPAEAQGIYLQLGPGISIPIGDTKDAGAKTGLVGQVAVGMSRGIIGGRVSATFIRHGLEGTDENFRVMGGMADLVVSPGKGMASPYLLAGAGMQNESFSVSGTPSETKFAWNAGAGVAVKMGGLGIFVEARFLSIKHDQSNTNLIPITAGLRLGGR